MADFVSIDDKTRQIIKNRIAAANELSGNFDEDAAKGKIKSFEATPVNYGNEGVSQAIANKFGKISQDKIREIQELQKLNHPRDVMKEIMGAGDLASKQYRLDKEREIAIRNRIQAEESQRAQVLGSILGVGGAFAGAYLGGLPGAAAGSKIGGLAGNPKPQGNQT
jgi:hypothetical protein